TYNGLCNNIWIIDGTFHDSSIEGIKVNYCNNVHVKGNTISDTNDNGIDVGNSISEVRGNTITRGGVPHGTGIHTDSARGSEIYENVITDSVEGIMVYRASNINIYDNMIKNAGISVPPGNGISIVSDKDPSYNIKVVHNIIQKPSGNAIYISSGQKIESLADNSLFFISRNIIENNLESPGSVGITGSSHVSNVIISNNIIRNTSIGILLEDTTPTAPPKSISVSGNIISGFTNYGIIAAYDGAVLDGNSIYGMDGIVADRNNSTISGVSPVGQKVGIALISDSLKILNNHIENVDDGIRWIGDSNSSLIQGNIIVSANRYGISDDPENDFTIHSHEVSNNIISDNRSPPKMVRGINFEGLSTHNMNIISNKIIGFVSEPAINLINRDKSIIN
ncbi:MAG TPA: right-handed parallel beta-helix repeat-containing protein, partial [Nitrososphaeraceae archaeon]|nr:right-handed parallel beta-helix repeat-containing protein [Nitrososphaeraceae archaeon]